jgi:ADP-ribosylglycohydrolase
MKSNIVLDGLFGLCVGDALGVPVEFKSREYLDENPVLEMIGFGTHNQPPGTWSDDSSLAFCLADSLCNGFNINDIAKKFIKWYDEALWTPHNEVFDIGNTTHKAIINLKQGVNPIDVGSKEEDSNGNGSLMRILPILYYIKSMELNERIPIIENVSAITHGHKRSKIACAIYIEMAINILNSKNLKKSYDNTKNKIIKYYSNDEELIHFNRLLTEDISKFKREQIYSSGYVVHTLEAAFWCLLTSHSYSETVLKAVNLGDDTDTTGAVAGGIAGIYYGYHNIPEKWIKKIAKKDEIITLSNKLYNFVSHVD